MAKQVIMPKLGMAMKEGQIAKWAKADGDSVTPDDTVAIIVTKKITYELKAPGEGILRHVLRAQETCLIGTLIGYVLAPGEAMPEVEKGAPIAPSAEIPVATKAKVAAADKGAAVTQAAPAQPGGFVVASPSARRLAREAGIDLALVPVDSAEGRVSEADVQRYIETLQNVLITPAARKLAGEHGLDITRIQGSGPGGRIVEDDIVRLVSPPPTAPTVPTPAPAPIAGPIGAAVPFTGLRQMIAENMVASLHSMAQVTVTSEIDVTELVDLRERLKKEFDLTYTDLIVKAVTVALRKHPRLNATLDGEIIQPLEEIHIGVGVALEEGLIVPVIRNADKLSVQEIGAALRSLAAKARSNSLEIDEISGGTFTITNLGAFGIDAFTPIINPPEVAILGVGRIVEKVVVYRGDVARRWMMVLSLTFDHRLVDGAPAAAFMQTLGDVLSHPYLIR
ncbi:MAG: catalytic protein [Chloroflexi bacterium]|nr:catalytic protein [Chloroflexota bacterium]